MRATAATAIIVCALATAASAHGGTARSAPLHARWTLHASVSRTMRYMEIDLRSDGTYVEHGGPNSSGDVDCEGRGQLTNAMLHVITDAIRQVHPRDWQSEYGVYAERPGADMVAMDTPVAVATPAPTPPALEQAFLRLSVAHRDYRTMVEFADGAYRNNAPADLVRIVNALQRPLTLCRPLDHSAPG